MNQLLAKLFPEQALLQQRQEHHLPHKYYMILRELFYIDSDTRHVANDMRYEPKRDHSVMHRDDTRKTRLSLRQINELRKASEAHILEQEQELSFIHSMYFTPPAPAA
jgi:hypothetical protein